MKCRHLQHTLAVCKTRGVVQQHSVLAKAHRKHDISLLQPYGRASPDSYGISRVDYGLETSVFLEGIVCFMNVFFFFFFFFFFNIPVT